MGELSSIREIADEPDMFAERRVRYALATDLSPDSPRLAPLFLVPGPQNNRIKERSLEQEVLEQARKDQDLVSLLVHPTPDLVAAGLVDRTLLILELLGQSLGLILDRTSSVA